MMSNLKADFTSLIIGMCFLNEALKFSPGANFSVTFHLNSRAHRLTPVSAPIHHSGGSSRRESVTAGLRAPTVLLPLDDTSHSRVCFQPNEPRCSKQIPRLLAPASLHPHGCSRASLSSWGCFASGTPDRGGFSFP